MLDMADGNGGSGFAFALPARSRWDRALASITLMAPGATAVLDTDTDRPRDDPAQLAEPPGAGHSAGEGRPSPRGRPTSLEAAWLS